MKRVSVILTAALVCFACCCRAQEVTPGDKPDAEYMKALEDARKKAAEVRRQY